MSKAIGYCRVSTREQKVDGMGLEIQAEAIEAYCKLRGIELCKVLSEDVTGVRPWDKRPQGQLLWEIVESGEVDHVVVYCVTRLGRMASLHLAFAELCQRHNVNLHVCNMGGNSVDLGSPQGRFIYGMFAMYAQLERDVVVQRSMAGMAKAVGERQVVGRTGLWHQYRCEDCGELALGNNTKRCNRGKCRGRMLAEDNEDGLAVLGVVAELRERGYGCYRIAKLHDLAEADRPPLHSEAGS